MAYPKLQINYLTHSQLADNIWHAQMAAHPRVLTYAGPDIVLRRETRHAALHFNHGGSLFEIPHVLSRDEYPFACTLEGGSSSWVGHIPGRENSAQGGLIAAFLVRHNVRAGRGILSKFEVEVINHPKGAVTNSSVFHNVPIMRQPQTWAC